MSGGSNSTSSTQSMPSFVQPYAQAYLDRGAQIADQPYQAYTGQRQAGLNATQYAGLDAIQNRALNGSPVMDAANNALQDTAGGQYLNANPYLQTNIDNTMGDMSRAYNLTTAPALDRAAAQSGSFGNSGVQQMQQESQRQLTQQMGNTAASMRMQNYGTERGNQMSALSMAPTYANQDYTDASQLMGAGNMLQNNQQGLLDQQYQNWQEAQNYPIKQLQTLGGLLTGNYGGTTTTQGASGSPAAGWLGAALAAYAASGK